MAPGARDQRGGARDAFPPTRVSVVRGIASTDPAIRREAYGALVRHYWRPVYAYVRLRWHRDPADAQDLTQEFFTRAFEKEYLEKYDPARARFRTFVRTCLDGFLANERQAATRIKRGGGVAIESIDFSSADADLANRPATADTDPDIWFRDEWIRSLFSYAVGELQARCRSASRPLAFALFQRYDVDGPDDPARPTYASLAREFDVPATEVTTQLAWARRTFRDIVLDTLRMHCSTDEEFRAEARDVLGISLP
jgi:RNA polymerase sigma factor (sigma-70 family)